MKDRADRGRIFNLNVQSDGGSIEVRGREKSAAHSIDLGKFIHDDEARVEQLQTDMKQTLPVGCRDTSEFDRPLQIEMMLERGLVSAISCGNRLQPVMQVARFEDRGLRAVNL